MLRFGYNTNGMAHHRLDEALELLADLGYQGCAITLDAGQLDPCADTTPREVARIGTLARKLKLGLVVETGARYLLDPRKKHQPTLLSDDPQRRLEFLHRAIAIAEDLGAECVSLWSGTPEGDCDRELAWSRLIDRLGPLTESAVIAFEPEPGMLVEDMAGFRRLQNALPKLKLTLDLGHAHLTEGSVADTVRQFAAPLVNVHAEDMRRPQHEHLPFGQGEMDYGPILAALAEVSYRGLINVELSRDSHRAPEMARAAIAYLRKASFAGQEERA
jgi:sugar phosphate isomerase/epimerase